MRKTLLAAALVAASGFVGTGVASAAPPASGAGTGNHPYFPLVCDGGPFDGPTTGFVVQANAASSALPTGFFYPGSFSLDGPDLDASPVVGVTMYREFLSAADGTVVFAEGRGSGVTLEKLAKRDDIAICRVPVPVEVDGLGSVYIRLYVQG
jgi:hypothetical protein